MIFINKMKEQLAESQSLFIGEETAFRSAVLIPIVELNGEQHILFQVRSFHMRKQPGDISFPGGRIDETDESPMAAAIRETHEELGVRPEAITLVGELSPYIGSSSFVIYPFVATFDYDEVIDAYNKEEVEEVFTIPLNWLLTCVPYMYEVSVEPVPPPDFPYEKIANGDQYQWRSQSKEQWFFDYKEYTIWGVTATILKHFIETIK